MYLALVKGAIQHLSNNMAESHTYTETTKMHLWDSLGLSHHFSSTVMDLVNDKVGVVGMAED